MPESQKRGHAQGAQELQLLLKKHLKVLEYPTAHAAKTFSQTSLSPNSPLKHGWNKDEEDMAKGVMSLPRNITTNNIIAHELHKNRA